MKTWVQLEKELQQLPNNDQRWNYLQNLDWENVEAEATSLAMEYLQELEDGLSDVALVSLLLGSEQQLLQALMILERRTHLDELLVSSLQELLVGEGLQDHFKSLIILLLQQKKIFGSFQVLKRGELIEFALGEVLSPFGDVMYCQLRNWITEYRNQNPSLTKMMLDELHFLALERTPSAFTPEEYQSLQAYFQKIISDHEE